MKKIIKSEEQKEILSAEEYEVLRQKKTEIPFSGTLLNNKNKGIYICKACKNKLFSSDDKFDSGSGWPSFKKPYNENNIELENDFSLEV